MINPEELAICRRRGHATSYNPKWAQCKWCGIWSRQVVTIEEREDDPPEEEQEPFERMRRSEAGQTKKLDELLERLDAGKAEAG